MAPAGGDGPTRRGRVLWLIKGLEVGGAERLLVELAAQRDREHFDYEAAYVLATRDALAGDLEASGVPVHPLGARSSLDLRWMAELRRLLRQGCFDIVHAHLPYAASLGRLVARSLPAETRPTLIYTEHSLWNKTAVLTRVLNRSTVHMDSALFVVSEASHAALPVALRSHARVVVHGIDQARSAALVERRFELRRRLHELVGADIHEVIAITVANLRPEKGYDVLLGAAQATAAMGIPMRFVSVGWGPLEQTLVDECRARALDEKVVFLGRRSDALELMAGSDLFVLPSHHEGLPVALMEAMSVGLPTVATEVGGVPGVVIDEVSGLLVPPGRPDLLADAVARLSQDETLRAKLASGALAAGARFDVATASRAIEEVYRELLARQNRP
ncbi:MAG TPA: glycosyltransferase [Acidimicrobiales bacterium]|nr:glycosyltransferase [Acidimicrobiales bacterium]